MDLSKNPKHTLAHPEHRGEFERIEELLGAFLFGIVTQDLPGGALQGLTLCISAQHQTYLGANGKFPALVHVLGVERKPQLYREFQVVGGQLEPLKMVVSLLIAKSQRLIIRGCYQDLHLIEIDIAGTDTNTRGNAEPDIRFEWPRIHKVKILAVVASFDSHAVLSARPIVISQLDHKMVLRPLGV